LLRDCLKKFFTAKAQRFFAKVAKNILGTSKDVIANVVKQSIENQYSGLLLVLFLAVCNDLTGFLEISFSL